MDFGYPEEFRPLAEQAINEPAPPSNLYRRTRTSTDLAMVLKQPPGFHQTALLLLLLGSIAGVARSADCPPGTYQESGGSEQCTLCPIGRNNAAAGGSLADCAACDGQSTLDGVGCILNSELCSLGPGTGCRGTLRGFSSEDAVAYLGLETLLAGVWPFSRSAPCMGDLNGDRQPDVIIGNGNTGKLRLFLSESTIGIDNTLSNTFRYSESSTSVGLNSIDLTSKITPASSVTKKYAATALGDLTGDGMLDLVAGQYSGELLLFANNGTLTNPDFSSDPTVLGRLPSAEYSSAPTLADFDGDGLLDIVAGGASGGLYFYRGVSSGSSSSSPATFADPVAVQTDSSGGASLNSGQCFQS